MKILNGGRVIIVALLVLALGGCGPYAAEKAREERKQEEARTEQIEALVEPAVVIAESNGEGILAIIKSHNALVEAITESYIDAAEADADALRDLATSEMRTEEKKLNFRLSMAWLWSCIVLVAMLVLLLLATDRKSPFIAKCR